MPAPQSIINLVQRFDDHREDYRSGKYNEAQLRVEFLNPFFEALGWDVLNRNGYALDYREVVSEDSIAIEGQAKAPDYAFKIGRERKFFVEAKKPSVDIAGDIHPAYQLRRYAWNVHLPLSILTDFEEFAVYDCRSKPNPTDPAATGRTMFLKYTQYIEKWDEIAGIFSRDAVLKGSFDQYALENKGKKGTSEVDDEFLKSIEEWRTLLARNIALRNPQVADEQQLNFAVQMTIDRIIFLRICEDRSIEPENQLQAIAKIPEIYRQLVDLFQRADLRYNSGLFHFKNEKGQTNGADTFTPSLRIDDRVLKEIINSMYYPCPYIFKEIPVEILGQVYEQFLGKVIRLTAGHQAKIEEKPEVRKAGGVYYTPAYIVNYIVQNTVGKLLEGKTPAEAAELKIVDPACGSGSFLLGAYQYLLDWHEDWYSSHDPEKWARGKEPALVQVNGGSWKLTTSARKSILVNNIHGVDIDPQAVEVTKLSLLLKVLEEESGQLSFAFERILPDLGRNIQCGNSLIGPDYFEGRLVVEEAERRRVNAFDWQQAFPSVFARGGFDAVIGNPPYIPIESMTEREKNYYSLKNEELERKFDSSIVFILEGLEKLNKRGLLGFISSITWQTGENYVKLRRTLFANYGVKEIINLPFNVFKDAFVDTGLYILSFAPSDYYNIFQFPKKVALPSLMSLEFSKVPAKMITGPDYKLVLVPKAQMIMSKLLEKENTTPFGSFTISAQGLAGNVFKKSAYAKDDRYTLFLEKGQVHRYSLDIQETCFVDMSEFTSLIRFYEAKPKILIRRVISRQDRLLATYSELGIVTKKDINPFVPIDAKWNPYFVLGILNSKLISYIYINSSSIATKDDFRQTTLAELRRLPIINFTQLNNKHSHLVALVQRMLDLHKQTPVTPFEQERLARDISATDAEIDRLVYDLYDLTPEEVKIVEG